LINQTAIRDFLARKLANYDWLKAYTAAQLDNDLNRLSPKPALGKIELWLHQKACFLLLLELKRFMLFIDMGGGKTLISLMLLKYRKQRGEKPRAMVFVPYITSADTWIEQTQIHSPDLKCVPLLGTKEQNLELLKGTGDLFVACYQTAVAMCSHPVKDPKTKKTHWELRKDLAQLFAGVDTLICDEIHRCKSHTSLTYLLCRSISSRTEYVLGLTGTPFGRDLQDLWPQFFLIDFGATLGATLGIFRGSFFNQKINYFGGYEYEFRKRMMFDLKRTLKNASISYSIDEFYDMPSKEYVVKHLPPPEVSHLYIEKAIEELNTAIKGNDYHTVQSNYLQLRQLSSGFMTVKGEDIPSVQIKFEENPKLEALVDLLEAMPHGCKAVVFHHFIYSNHVISDKLKELKIKHARIWGGQKDPIAELRRFKEDPDCTVLVINWKSGSSSLNLQGANYLICYEQPDSPIDRKQGEARVWRPGQGKRVFIYDLLVRRTVDDRMHKSNEAGKDLLKELLSGKGI
jgi:SNF2 family DNA or RNA helicase